MGTLEIKGNLSNSSSLLIATVAPETVTLSAVKKWENGKGKGLVVRAYNANNETIEATISVAMDVDKAFLTNLNEVKQKEIPLLKNKREINVVLTKYKIVTVLFLFKDK